MKLKRIFIFFGILISLLITSCSRNVAIDNEPLDTNYGGSKTLIAYFSFSGNTMELANMIEEEVSGDILGLYQKYLIQMMMFIIELKVSLMVK